METILENASTSQAANTDTANNGQATVGKNIIICCDGTGNVIGEQQTNVVKLVRSALRDQKLQRVYYDPGVGTMSAPEAMTKVAKGFSRVMGLALGHGIRRNIEEAYLYLMAHYNPNDRVFLFGFSRGAYTVCSLAAMLHECGLLEKGNENLVPLALQIYQKSKKKDKSNPEKKLGDGELFKATFSRECKPHFLGVWDTVASVGLIGGGNPFPSANLNPDIKHVRHAVSIDEKRQKFPVELWEKPANAETETIKEVWFAGVHSDIGGGYPEKESGLSKLALEWMISEAVAIDKVDNLQGKDKSLQIHAENCIKTLGFPDMNAYLEHPFNQESGYKDTAGKSSSGKYGGGKKGYANYQHYRHTDNKTLPDAYAEGKKAPDYQDLLHNSLTFAWKILDLLLSISPKYQIGRRRAIPENAHVHASALLRWKNGGTDGVAYRPRNLQSFIDKLPAGWEEDVVNILALKEESGTASLLEEKKATLTNLGVVWPDKIAY